VHGVEELLLMVVTTEIIFKGTEIIQKMHGKELASGESVLYERGGYGGRNVGPYICEKHMV
jgi:hypothetical protein